MSKALKFAQDDVEKLVTLISLAPLIARMIDEDPQISWQEIVDRLKAQGWRNTRGRVVPVGSISWILQTAYGDKYRRVNKHSKSKYSERSPITIKNTVVVLSEKAVFVEPPHVERFETESKPTYTSIKTEPSPDSISGKDLVSNHLTGQDAKELYKEYGVDHEYKSFAETQPIKTEYKVGCVLCRFGASPGHTHETQTEVKISEPTSFKNDTAAPLGILVVQNDDQISPETLKEFRDEFYKSIVKPTLWERIVNFFKGLFR